MKKLLISSVLLGVMITTYLYSTKTIVSKEVEIRNLAIQLFIKSHRERRLEGEYSDRIAEDCIGAAMVFFDKFEEEKSEIE